MDKSQKDNIKLIITGKNEAKTFDTAEKSLDLIALLVQLFIIVPRIFAIAFGWDNRCITKFHGQSPGFIPFIWPGPSEDKLDGPLDRASATEYVPPDHRRSFRRTVKGLPHPYQMRRPYEAWCSIHLVFFRWIELRFFNAPIPSGCTLMQVESKLITFTWI